MRVSNEITTSQILLGILEDPMEFVDLLCHLASLDSETLVELIQEMNVYQRRIPPKTLDRLEALVSALTVSVTTSRVCHCGLPGREFVDGEWLCQSHYDEWVRGERPDPEDPDRDLAYP